VAGSSEHSNEPSCHTKGVLLASQGCLCSMELGVLITVKKGKHDTK
jgi:hypothetical protein